MDTSLKVEADKLTARIGLIINKEQEMYEQYSQKVKDLSFALQNDKRLQGDLSENNSYHIAKEERDVAQAMLNVIGSRIEALQCEVNDYVPSGFITLGTTVELRLISIDGQPSSYSNQRFIVRVVNHATGKAADGFVAIDSPVGDAIIGKSAGDEVIAISPGGRVQYKIERIY